MAVKRGRKVRGINKGARRTHTVTQRSPTSQAHKNSNKATGRGRPGSKTIQEKYDEKQRKRMRNTLRRKPKKAK